MRILQFIWSKFVFPARNYIIHFFKERSIVRKLGDVDEFVDYSLMPTDASSVDPKSMPIYVMWWQGEAGMPEIVRACYLNLLSKAGNHPVHLITQENYLNFIDVSDGYWDSIILEKVRNGQLKLAHFADIIRMYLTAYKNHGGIWIDATVYITANCIDDIISLPFTSVRREKDEALNWTASRCRWGSFFFTALKGNPLSQFLYNGLVRLLQVDGTIEDYYTMDYLFDYAYWHIKGVKGMVNSSPAMRNLVHVYDGSGTNEIYSKKRFESLCRQTPIFKLTYKAKSFKSIDGKQTVYGYLTSNQDRESMN